MLPLQRRTLTVVLALASSCVCLLGEELSRDGLPREGRGSAPRFEASAESLRDQAESLRDYKGPEWFHDAKFGVYLHSC